MPHQVLKKFPILSKPKTISIKSNDSSFLNHFLTFFLLKFYTQTLNIGFSFKLKGMKVRIKFLRKSLVVVRNLLNGFLRFRYLWREIRLLYLLSVISFAKDNFRLSGIKPFASVFVSISNINTEPIFIVINKMPSTPNQTLYVNVAIIYVLNIFSHSAILITVSYFF